MITGDGTGGTDGTDSVILTPGLIATIHSVTLVSGLIIGHLTPGALPAGTATDTIIILIIGAIRIITCINQSIILIITYILVLAPMVLLPPATVALQDLRAEFFQIQAHRVIILMQILAVCEGPLHGKQR